MKVMTDKQKDWAGHQAVCYALNRTSRRLGIKPEDITVKDASKKVFKATDISQAWADGFKAAMVIKQMD